MIAVSDTSPLCYLTLIGEIDVLPKLFEQILITESVLSELLHQDAPEAVRTWASSLPNWIAANADPSLPISGLEKLQAGERTAILLAESKNAGMLLIDEKAARQIAVLRGLKITGTLGILGEAASRSLVQFNNAIDRLRMTSFRASPALLKAALDQFGNL